MLQFRMGNVWVIGLFLLLVLAGCGSESGGELAVEEGTAADVELSVQMNDNYFGENPDDQPTWSVAADNTVSLSLSNQGGLRHNWAIVEAGADVPEPFREGNGSHADLLLFDSGKFSGGESGMAVFQAPTAGTYQVICTVAGHYPSMQGTLVVE